MVRWLLHFLYAVLWGSPKKPDVPLNVGSNRVMGWQSRYVLMNVFMNHTLTGKPYLKVQFKKQVGKDKEKHLANSFLVDDLADIEKCIARIRAWLRDNEALS